MRYKCTLIFFFLGLSIQLFAQSDFNPDKKLTELTGKRGNIGITAAYSVNGDIKWSNSAGNLCSENNNPFSTTTLTRIASISKNFTAVAIMQLVEKNLVELDTPVENYLSNFPSDKKEVTVRQLLAHTAGIPQYQDKKEIENTIHYESLKSAMNVFIKRPLLFEPGSKFFYSTYGYVILGRIIEEVSALSYQEYMRRNIFDIAGMNSTGIEDINEQYEDKSCLYHKDRRRVKKGKQNDLSNRIPGGGYYSTLEDILKFGDTLLEGKLIELQTLNKMLQTQAVEYDGNKYGLGWFLYGPPPNENSMIGHGGGQTGCTSQLIIIPKTKTVIVVLSNTSGNYPDIATYASNLIRLSQSKK